MLPIIFPNIEHREQIANGSQADGQLCWTCGSCDFECPVNNATNRLRPQKIVRMASLGMLNELLHHPALWYCLSCRRCWQICPNAVKPAVLIEYLRRESIRARIVSADAIVRYRKLFARFHRIRWHAVTLILKGELKSITDRQWHDWLHTPVSAPSRTITLAAINHRKAELGEIPIDTRLSACFTCGECSSACPIACERDVFDPRTIFRMANLSLTDKLLTSPSIWLCVGCGRCSEACSQLVDGRNMILALRNLAFESGAVDPEFPSRLAQADRIVYARFLDAVDDVMGLHLDRHHYDLDDRSPSNRGHA